MKILAADLWPSSPGNQTFVEGSKLELLRGQVRLRQLIENVLLYDQVILPTDNFLSLLFLAQAFGQEVIARLIDEEILKFVRYAGQLVYVGGGSGLTAVKLAVEENTKRNRPVGPAWLPTGVAATAILRDLHRLPELQAKRIAAKVVHATKEIDMNSVLATVRDRTSAAVHSEWMDRNLRVESPDLKNLGVPANQIRILGDFERCDVSDDVGKLMAVARTQLELATKKQCGCDDLSTLSPVGKILHAESQGTALNALHEITDVPDLGTALMHGAVSIDQIVRLRNSRHWQEFAKWFHEECAKEPKRVGREYVKLLRSEGPQDTTFFKIVRLLIATVAGLINPVVGIGAAAADTFLTPKLKPPSPKFFIEELEQLSPGQIGELH